MPQRSAAEYVALARRAIIELLEKEHAAAWLEIEAKIADAPWPGVGIHVDRHHVSAARIELLRSGLIVDDSGGTRGGRDVGIIHAADTRRRKTAIAAAAGRKRLLVARYLGWAQGTESRAGIIGPAAEQVVHASLRESAIFRMVNPDGGQVRSLLGVELDGPLDNAVFLTPLGGDGVPGAPVTVPIEVKNIRDWIYPSSQELYQLLDKAARVQESHPALPVVPVLVCRRAHYTSYRMAKAMGFFIIEARRQYIGHVDADKLQEVRAELGFLDLAHHEGPDRRLVHMFADVFPDQAAASAGRWLETVADQEMRVAFAHMRHDGIATRRARTLEVLRRLADRAGIEGGW